jgi:Uma2 family endonuclease
VRIVVSDPPPGDFEALLERRRRLGLDRQDEVWEGVLHVNPLPHGRHTKVQQQIMALLDPLARAAGLTPLAASNLGDRDDYRGPDGLLQHPGADRLFYPTAALVLEVVSPGDETWDKLAFYAAHEVEELLIVDPQQRTVDWLTLEAGHYRPTTQSALIDLGPASLANQIDWPALED